VDLDFGVFSEDLGRYHAGEDVYDEAGTPVYAMAEGTISYSGYAYGYGYLITIDHPDLDVYSLYGHLSTRRWKKTEGTVNKGELIAYLGDEDENTGGNYTVPPHLHFGIRKGSRYDYPGDASDNRFTAGWTYTHPANLGWMDATDFINVMTDISDISEQPSLSPHTFELLPNYPNPFNSKTTIKIILNEPLTVNLNVYDVNGRLIRSLVVNELWQTGIYLVEWDGRDKSGRLVATGIYCYQLEIDGHRKTRSMILLK